MQPFPLITKDGSHSLHVPELGATYHSIHGALTESRHVFVNAGLKYRASFPYEPPLKILEMGLGTGLNALLTLEQAEKEKFTVSYTAIEAFPLREDIVAGLNYVELMERPDLKEKFMKLHQLPFGNEFGVAPHFIFKKINNRIENVLSNWKSGFDTIYYDAFAPLSQPELWIPAIFEKLFESLRPKGILVTYCSKGEVRRTMQQVGFEVSRIPGPPGKREMLRAVRN